LLNKVEAFYGISGDGQTAFIEMAAASGLALLNRHEYNAMKATSYGTGELILHALDHGCRNIIIGLGGSATNDGAAGLLQALGLGLLDQNQSDLVFGGGNLGDLFAFDLSQFDPREKQGDVLSASPAPRTRCLEGLANEAWLAYSDTFQQKNLSLVYDPSFGGGNGRSKLICD